MGFRRFVHTDYEFSQKGGKMNPDTEERRDTPSDFLLFLTVSL